VVGWFTALQTDNARTQY